MIRSSKSLSLDSGVRRQRETMSVQLERLPSVGGVVV